MKCKYCNAEVQPNTRFCTSCGGDLSKFDKCVNCGEFIDKGESTCPHCGTEQPQPVLSEKGGSKKWLLIIVAVLLLGILGGGGYYLMSNKSESPSIVQENDSIPDLKSVEGARQRLGDILSKALNMGDKEAIHTYFSKEYQELFDKVEKLDKEGLGEEMGFWNGNIWDGGQDGNPNSAEIIQINTSSDTYAFAQVKLTHQEGEYKSEEIVSMDLIFENDDWRIADVSGYKVMMKEYIESCEQKPLITIEDLRNVSFDDAFPQQGFSKTTYSVREGYETSIWYKNCEIDKNGKIHSENKNSCVVEVFDGMSASLRITTFDKAQFESIKEQVLEYSVKTDNDYYFKWKDNEKTHLPISMGESDYFEGGYYIDIPLD